MFETRCSNAKLLSQENLGDAMTRVQNLKGRPLVTHQGHMFETSCRRYFRVVSCSRRFRGEPIETPIAKGRYEGRLTVAKQKWVQHASGSHEDRLE